jgi:hypothetical protein
MSKKIKKILNRLYVIDSGLKDYEKELKVMLRKFINVYPPTKFDDDFLKTLREELVEKEYDFEKIVKKIDAANKKTVTNVDIIKFSHYILGAIALAIILMTAIAYYFFDEGLR